MVSYHAPTEDAEAPGRMPGSVSAKVAHLMRNLGFERGHSFHTCGILTAHLCSQAVNL